MRNVRHICGNFCDSVFKHFQTMVLFLRRENIPSVYYCWMDQTLRLDLGLIVKHVRFQSTLRHYTVNFSYN